MASGPFGFNPDYSLKAPGPSFSEHYQDPAFRLDFHWQNQDTQRMAKELDQKRLLDGTALNTILDDQRRNQQHWDDVNQRLGNFMETMNKSVPVREIAKMDWADTIAGGLGLALGGRADSVLGGVQNIEQQRADTDYQNKLNQFNVDRENRMVKLQQLQREFDQATSEGRQIHQSLIDEYQRLNSEARQDERTKQQEIEKARDRFANAKNEGEVIQAALDLKALGHPVDTEALTSARQAASLKYQGEGRMQIQQIIAMQRPGMTEGEKQQTQENIDAISKQYGLPMVAGKDGQMHATMLIPGSMPWKAQLEFDKQAFLEKYRREQLRQHAKEVGIKEEQAASLVALHRAEIDWLSQRPGIAYEQIAASSGKYVRAADEKLAFANGKLGEIERQIAQAESGTDPLSGQPFKSDSSKGLTASQVKQKRLNDLRTAKGRQQSVVSGYTQARKLIEEEGGIDKSGGAAALGGETGSAAPKIGDRRAGPDGVLRERHADGKWYPVQP